mmetsp:Transcript_75929/g.180516  ORF Transcript_75929/g.180516 Transcript_75929/m.180516 type:complete len:209 (-) Transcript_75929:646-1272(-)
MRIMRRWLLVVSEIETPEVRDGLLKTFSQLNLWFPLQVLSGSADVRLPLLGIITWKWHKDYLAGAASQLQNKLSQLQHGELMGIPNVHRSGGLLLVHHSDHALNQVLNVTEGSRLGAISIDCDVLTVQRLHDEVTHHSAIVWMHPWAICIEDANYSDVHIVASQIIETKRLSRSLTLIVAGSNTNAVDMAPVVLRLRGDFRIAVDLTS